MNNTDNSELLIALVFQRQFFIFSLSHLHAKRIHAVPNLPQFS
jgi:hypothetical protein